MAWLYYIDVPQRLVFTQITGIVRPEDIQAETNAVKNDPKFDPSFNQLVDAFDSKPAPDFSADKIRELGSNTIFNNTVRRAIIVSGDLAFGLARMFGTYREIHGESNIQVFRSREAALNWLGVTMPVIPPHAAKRQIDPGTV